MLARPRVATFVSHAFARVALVRMCQVHFVRVVRIFRRRNQKYVGITMLAQIINAATRAYRLHDKAADNGHTRTEHAWVGALIFLSFEYVNRCKYPTPA